MRLILDDHDALEGRIEMLDHDIDDGLMPWEDRIVLLRTLPGIDRDSACAVLAGIGPDLDAFGSSDHRAAVGLSAPVPSSSSCAPSCSGATKQREPGPDSDRLP